MALIALKDMAAGDLASPTDFTAASASDTFYDDGRFRTFYVIKNGSGSSITATVTRVQTTLNVAGLGGLTVAARTKAVGAGEVGIIGPFAPQFINTDGQVTVTLSSATSVTVAAVRIPPL